MKTYKVDYIAIEDYTDADWMLKVEDVKTYMEVAKYPEIEVILALIGIKSQEEVVTPELTEADLKELFGIDEDGESHV